MVRLHLKVALFVVLAMATCLASQLQSYALSGGTLAIYNYDGSQAYVSGNTAVGSDGNWYRAIASTTGNDPTSDGNTKWEMIRCNGNTTLSVSGGGRFATIVPALAFIRNAVINTGATVTISVANGTYTHSAQITIAHPYGSRISIVGDTTTPANVVLNFSSSTNGIVVDKGTTLGNLNGFMFKGTWAGSGSTGLSLSAIFAYNGSRIFCGDVNGTVCNIVIDDFYYGLNATKNGTIIAEGTSGSNGVTVTDAGDVGVFAYRGSFISCPYADVSNSRDTTRGFGWGIEAEVGSVIHCDYASATTCSKGGIFANGGHIRAYSSTSDSNTGYGFQAERRGVIEVQGTVSASSNGLDNVHLDSGSVFEASGTSTLTFNSSTAGNGVYAANGSIAKISGATCGANGLGNHLSGVYALQGGRIYIASGSCRYNAGSGIRCYGRAYVMAAGATASNNSLYGVDSFGNSMVEMSSTSAAASNTSGDLLAQYDTFIYASGMGGSPACTPASNTFPVTGSTSGCYIKI
jgi:hypothetical protein